MRKVMEKGEVGKNGDGFIDRSKVRILLCENDSKSSEEVFTLLCKCSYQVTSVRSPRQVVDALNAEGADIDIILSEVDLPMSKGLKMLKYLMRDKELRRIPVIMMSAQDEVSIVVKCLKLGAADYLVKPLRTNELLNLWTHMWRRRQMLGLAEKNILSYDFDLIGSDPSDANTNSTTLFSDDTDEKSRKACSPTMKEDEVNATSAAPINSTASVLFSKGCQLDVPEISDQWAGQMLPFSKKSELKIGESSAFFTYVKSSTFPIHNSCLLGDQVIADSSREYFSNDDFTNIANLPESLSPGKTCTPPSSLELSQQKNSSNFSHVPTPRRNESHNDVVPSFQTNAPYPYYIHQMMMSPPSPMYQNNLPMLPQYSHMPHCYTNPPGMPSFPFYPYGVCLQPGQQIPSLHPWPPSYNGNTSSSAAEKKEKPNKMGRREAALIKFRQKRKERCFNKKIRYVNRKKLAEQRPRVRGQFIGKINGMTVDLNGVPASVDDDDDDVDEDDDEDEEK